MWTVTKEFSFEAAHSLPHLPVSHKCHHLHGHSYKVVVVCQSASLDGDKAWVVDYADISAVVDPLIGLLDHKNLNEVMGGLATTAENVAYWFYWQLRESKLRGLVAIEVRETEKTNVIYRP